MEHVEQPEVRIRQWCTDYIARVLNLSPGRIDPNVTFARLGLDSATAVFLVVELEEWLGVELESEIVFDHPSIAELARHVAARLPGHGLRAG